MMSTTSAKSERIIALIDRDGLSPIDFNARYVEKIEEAMAYSIVRFVFSDRFILAARFLSKRGYRRCTVYHLGDVAKHSIGNYAEVGQFTSYIEIENALRHDSYKAID